MKAHRTSPPGRGRRRGAAQGSETGIASRVWWPTPTTGESRAEAVCLLDGDQKVRLCNQAMLKLVDKPPAEVIGQDCRKVVPACVQPEVEALFPRMAKSLQRETAELALQEHSFEVCLEPVLDAQGTCHSAVLILRNVTRSEHEHTECQKLIADLQQAVNQARKLSGLLPICCSCKRIRDGVGVWHWLENYLAEHSEATFSHSLCPECAHKLYPEVFG